MRNRPYRKLILVGAAGFLAFLPLRWMYTATLVTVFRGFRFHIESHPVVEELLKPQETPLMFSLVFSVAISAPFFEEIFFRGFLYQALRKNVPAWAAIIATAALFAGIHPSWFQRSLIFPLGLVLAYLMEKNGSVIPCIVLHFLINGTSLVQTFLNGL